eukprot:scaffold1082_cov43-Cyclotella_meneghiniana.AAC.1
MPRKILLKARDPRSPSLTGRNRLVAVSTPANHASTSSQPSRDENEPTPQPHNVRQQIDALSAIDPIDVDFNHNNVPQALSHDDSSLAREFASFLDDASTDSSQRELFCDIDDEILNNIDEFTQSILNSESSQEPQFKSNIVHRGSDRGGVVSIKASMTSSNMTTTRITIREWMFRALQLKSSNDLSHKFIIAAALRIAISLAEQVENNNAVSFEDGVLPLPFPMSRIDWADIIEVSYNDESDDLESSPGPLCANATAAAPSDLATDTTFINQRGAEAGTNDEGRRSIPPLLNVSGAKLVHNNVCNSSNKDNTPNGELQRIYSLGLVFYQLFSLGQTPLTPELVVVSSRDGELTPFSSRSNALPINDFSRALHVSDDHSTNGNNSERAIRESESESFAKRQSTARVSSSGIVHCDEPINLLRIRGVPSSICDLVRNMIDCINGSLMGNDSYSKMSDVTFDLQLMLQKPSIYLDPLDKEKLVQVGLELYENMPFGRDEEFASLQYAYQRSMSGSSELAVITGLSGSGKTMIANCFRDFVITKGGLFISGKFDQMRENSYQVVASAFNKYCEELAREENSVQAVLVAFRLREALGNDVAYLTRMIPNLRCVMNDDVDESFLNHECTDAQRRIHYLLSRFVDVICEASEMPMVLFLDDLQWADSSSVVLINQLLQSSRSRNGKFFFLGSFRHDYEAEHDHPFWSTITTANSLGYTTTTVELVYLSKKLANQFVADLLHLSPRLVASLSDIVFHKTKGNPLFIARMLLSLNSKGLLYLSLTRNRWEWDEEKI